MKVTYAIYNQKKSLENIKEILNDSDNNYPSKNNIPSRDTLTYSNGFYVGVTVVFIDIRGSKELSAKHTRPVLAKIYRAYISEVIAMFRNNTTISEIYIEGDGLWAVFNTPNNSDVQSIFDTVSQTSSLITMLNKRLVMKGYSSLEVGIGIEDGETLYMQAGYKGSGINEVVWIGKAVGEAAKMCNHGNRTSDDKQIMISERVYGIFTKYQQGFFTYNHNRSCYHGSFSNKAMNEFTNA